MTKPRVIYFLVDCFVTLIIFVVGVNFVVTRGGHNDAESERPTTAFIFGGGLKDDGTQSSFQADRVLTGVELYKSGKVNHLIMTGDDGARWGNEVQAMKLMAVQLGVPSSSIEIDPHGYRTYDSCWRAVNVYNYRLIMAVSQNFHLDRLAYLCRRVGVGVIGVSADRQNYGWVMVKAQAREVLARVKAFIDINLIAPPVSAEK